MTATRLALILTAFPLAALAGDGLIRNRDFEQGAAAWKPDAGMKRQGAFGVTMDAKRKSAVMRVENKGVSGSVSVFQEIPIRPGKVYELSGWVRSTKLQEGAGVAFHCLDSKGKLIKRVWAHHVPSWGALYWREIWERFTPPKGTAKIQLKLIVYKKGTVWFDDLALVEKDRPKKEKIAGKPITDAGLAVTRIATPKPLYALDVDDLDGDGSVALVVADVDGVVRLQRGAAVQWARDMGGLVHSIDCGDVDGDGRKEIAVCTMNRKGEMVVMDAEGKTLWTFAVPGKLFNHVTVGDLDGDGKCEVFVTCGNQLIALSPAGQVLWQRNFGGPRMRMAAVGDVNGDGKRDVVASLRSQRIFAAAFGAQGQPLWRYQPRGLKRISTEDVHVADVDGDGKNEVVLGCAGGLVLCIRDGDTLWAARREKSKRWPKHRDATANFGSQQSHTVVADFCKDRPGLETLVSLVDTVWLLDSRGKRIWETESGILVRDMTLGPDGAVYAPSSGFRDPSLYRLRLVRGQGNPLADYKTENPIYDTLEGMYEQVRALKPMPAPANAAGKLHVIYANIAWPHSRWGSYERLKKVHEFLKTKESEHLEFVFMLWPKDLPVELHRGGMIEQKEILEVVQWLEKLGRPFMFFADHGCSPNLSLDTIEKTFQLAPNTCRGMYVAENTAHYPSQKWDDFVEWAMKVMDLCLKYGGKKMVFKEMFESWAFIPADPKVQATLLQPKYRDVLVAMYATNNPYAPELQLGGMAGLKRAGLISDWGISTQYWNWSWGEQRTAQQNYTICPADVILRMELTSACLGGRWFHVEGGQIYAKRGEGALDPRARRHRGIVYELIRKRVLLPVRDEDNLSYSPVVLVRQCHPEQAQAQGKIGSPYSRPMGPLRSGLLGVNGALQTVFPGYFPSYAYGSRRYTSTMAPKTPYGFVRIMPDCTRVQAWLHARASGKNPLVPVLTDGCDVFLDGKRMSAIDAQATIVEALKRGRKQLPFRSQSAAAFVHRIGDGYRVFLLDPGYMNPTGASVSLVAQGQGAHSSAHDVLSGAAVAVQNGALRVHVRPGAFRVIDVRPR